MLAGETGHRLCFVYVAQTERRKEETATASDEARRFPPVPGVEDFCRLFCSVMMSLCRKGRNR